DAPLPKWLSSGTQNLIRRILDRNRKTRITIMGIKEDEWFKQDYTPTNVEDDDDEGIHIDDGAFLIQEVPEDVDKYLNQPTLINAYQVISMFSCLDLSGFFEKEDASEGKIRFTSNHSPKNLLEKIEDIVTEMGLQVWKKNRMVSKV
ncbi:hypothetical protein MKW98_000430, partial [Papaver atlanticum]